MGTLIVTSGSPYIDIDAYAGCIAYSELLNKMGTSARPVSLSTWNESIPSMLRPWGTDLETEYSPDQDDRFVLIDVSEPGHFDKFVTEENVVEVIDHHPGFETYWSEKIGDHSTIVHIGSAATLVYERWAQAGLLETIKPATAGLLIAAILDNTLNFGADAATERDKAAYDALMPIAGLPQDWPAQYFEECQKAITNDLPVAIKNDLKVLSFSGRTEPLCVGQLVMWDGQKVLADDLSLIGGQLSAVKPDWFMNLISIKDDASYLIASDEGIKAWLSDLLGIQFDGWVAKADRLWLRKEIMKRSQGTGQ